MRINGINTINIYSTDLNKPKTVQNKSIDNTIQQSSNNITGNYNVAFCGLFNRKKEEPPIDVRNLWATVPMKPQKSYLINPNSKFEMGNCGYILDLGSRELFPLISRLKNGQEIIIGREQFGITTKEKTIPIEEAKQMLDFQKAGSNLPVMDTTISRKHLKILKDKKGQLLAQDLNSMNGTKICQNICRPDIHKGRFKLQPGIRYILPYKSILSIADEPVILGELKNKFNKLNIGDSLIVGTGSKSDIKYTKNTISNSHLKLTKHNDGLLVEDLHSTNGTNFLGVIKKYQADYSNIIEETPLLGNIATKVPNDCQLYIGGDLTIDFRNPNILKELDKKGKITIGRYAGNDIVVPEFYNKVSRNHLIIEKDDNDIIVTDLSSTNGTNIVPKNKIRPFYGDLSDLELKQGNIGDCYLLSTIYAMSRNSNAREYLKEMVRVDSDGKYFVKFYNVPEITVLPDEMDWQENSKGERKYSVLGDLGIKAIERAYGKMLKSDLWLAGSCLTLHGPLDDGGAVDTALYKLTGIKSKRYNPKHKYMDKILTQIANTGISNHIITCTTPNKGKFGKYMDPYHIFPNNHAYSVKYIDPYSKFIGIINPHNTRIVHNISWDDFKEYFDNFYDAMA